MGAGAAPEGDQGGAGGFEDFAGGSEELGNGVSGGWDDASDGGGWGDFLIGGGERLSG